MLYLNVYNFVIIVMATEITGPDSTGLLSVGLFEERRSSNTS